MIALNLKELEIKNYYSKSNKQETWKNSYESWSKLKQSIQKNIWEKRIAELIIDTDIKEHLNFSDDFVLVEVKAPSTFWNNSLINLDVRINII